MSGGYRTYIEKGASWFINIIIIVYLICWLFDVPVFQPGTRVSASATGGSIAIGNDAIGNVLTVYQNSPEELAKMIKVCLNQAQIVVAEREESLRKVKDLSARLDIENDAVVSLLRVVGQEEVPIEQLQSKLVEIATQYRSTRRSVSKLKFTDTDTEKFVNFANDALIAGKFIEADEMLRQAALQERHIAQKQSLVPGEQLELVNVQMHLLNAARVEAGRGEISLMQLRYADAASHFADAAALIPENKDLDTFNIQGGFLLQEAKSHFLYGENSTNDRLRSFDKAVKLFQIVFNSEKIFTIESYALSQADFGSALVELSKQDSSKDYLNVAITAYKESLKEKAISLNQHDRMNVLLRLGAALMSKKSYKEAIAVYRTISNMCEACSRKKGGGWVSARLGLGLALAEAASQDGDVSFSFEAIHVLHTVSEVIDQKLDPSAWVESQVNLGYALFGAGKRFNQPESLHESISVLRSILRIIARNRELDTWVRVQFYLGCALEAQALQGNEPDAFEQANQAYSQALQESGALGPNLTQEAQEGASRTRKEILTRLDKASAHRN